MTVLDPLRMAMGTRHHAWNAGNAHGLRRFIWVTTHQPLEKATITVPAPKGPKHASPGQRPGELSP